MSLPIMNSVRETDCMIETCFRMSCAILVALASFVTSPSPLQANEIPPGHPLRQQFKQDNATAVVEVRAPDHCWCYTDPSRTQDFRDACT